MKPMRILIVPSWYPTTSKPVNGIFIREQADALSALHEVRVLFLDVLPRHTKRKPKHEVTHSRGYVEEIIEVPNVRFVWQFVYLLYMARALWRLRRTFDPEIVHAHIAIPAGWGAVMLRWLVGKPIVLTENSSEFESWLKRPGLRWMANRTFSGTDLVIAVSEGQRQRIERTFGRKKGLVIVPNIVNMERFTASTLPDTQDGYRLLFVGLMDTDQKGVHILLDALAMIISRNRLSVPLHVDLIGGGSLQAGYEAQAKRLNIEQHITFHGLQPHTFIAKMMQECHALVLPSLHEALPLVIIEAMASGRPVICTRCGGPEYMVGENTGVVVEPGQASVLADGITDVLCNLPRYDPQVIASIAKKLYSYEAVTKALTDIYTKLGRPEISA